MRSEYEKKNTSTAKFYEKKQAPHNPIIKLKQASRGWKFPTCWVSSRLKHGLVKIEKYLFDGWKPLHQIYNNLFHKSIQNLFMSDGCYCRISEPSKRDGKIQTIFRNQLHDLLCSETHHLDTMRSLTASGSPWKVMWTQKESTLPPIIMEVKNGSHSNSSFLSNIAIFHFHDYGRKTSLPTIIFERLCQISGVQDGWK